jgi:diguanylate cyclase (GGDEF)-like protein
MPMGPVVPFPQRRLRLEHKVALLSAVPIALLGFALANRLEAMFEDRLVAAARDVTAPGTQAMVDFFSTPEDYVAGYPPEKAAALKGVLGRYVDAGIISNMRAYRLDGLVVWSPDATEIGEHHPLTERTLQARDGEVHAFVADGSTVSPAVEGVGPGKTVILLNPIRFPGSGEITGITELYIPYGTLAQAMDQDVRRIYQLLGGGLLALWLLLGRIVTSASRTLRRQAAENERLALHDSLTGLPNRTLFQAELEQAIARAARAGRNVGVLLLDLDRFKEVNDSLGHHQGDELLVEVAERLRGTIRAGDTVARLGGDEFAVVLHDLDGADDAARSAARIHRVLEAPVDLGELQVQVEASIGIALHPVHGDDAGILVQRADVAMYAAKAARSDWAVYDAAVDPNSPHRLALVAQLRNAMDRGELVVHYQPVQHLPSGTTVAMEALVRWEHPTRGLVPPADFIPAAEGSGLIRPLTLHVLRQALQQCRAWIDGGFDVSIAVNLSARNIQDPRCAADVFDLLAETGLPPDRLVVEMTESAVLGDPTTAFDVLVALRAAGVRVALDDFGTGYSSLTQLKDFQIDEIKIDRSFVERVGEDATTTAIVESIVELGQRLNLHVVAEGVEDAVVSDRLAALGCELVQGFHFSRPLPAAAAGAWLSEHAVPPEEVVAAPER